MTRRQLFLASLLFGSEIAGCGGNSGRSDPTDYLSFITPHRWNQSVISYQIYDNDPNRIALIEQGASFWQVPNVPVFTSGSIAEVEIRPVGVDSLGPGRLGYSLWEDREGYTVRGVVYLLKTLLPSRLVTTAAHELGHILFCGPDGGKTNIRAHAPYKSSLMYATSEQDFTSLPIIDRHTVQMVYGG